MGKLKKISIDDPCWSSNSVQPVTWRNWAESGIDSDTFIDTAQTYLKGYATGVSLFRVNGPLLPTITELYGTWHMITSRNLNVQICADIGVDYSSILFQLSAMELMNEWERLTPSEQVYAVCAIYYAMSSRKSGFTIHAPQLTVAGFVAICTAIGIQTYRDR